MIKIQKGVSRLAIDVGNVISITDTDTLECINNNSSVNESTRSLAGATLDGSTPTMECVEAVRLLVHHFGDANQIFVLSKCKHDTQRKTMAFLMRPIQGGGSFLERTGLLPENVLFCTQRSGGDTDSLEMEYLGDTGARTAVEDVGKGAVARKFGLTHLIDDRDECLLSFAFEGHLAAGSEKMKDGALIQFGEDARGPEEDRVKKFVNGHGKSILLPENKRQDSVQDCFDKWIVAKGWGDVLKAFGIASTSLASDSSRRLTPKIPLGWDDLSDDQKKVYESLVEIINQPTAMVDAKYDIIPDSFGGQVIGTDAARELSEEYRSGWEGAFLYSQVTAGPASAYAQDRFRRDIETKRPSKKNNDDEFPPENRRMVLAMTAGGPASGKTSVVRGGLVDGTIDLVMDQNLGKYDRAVEQIELALANDWDVRIVYVFKPFELVATKVIERASKYGRWSPVSGHGHAHRTAQASVLKLYDRYLSSSRVQVQLMENLYSKDNPVPVAEMTVEDIRPGGKYHLGDKIEWMDLQVVEAVTKAKASGNIEPRLMAALESHA